MYDTDVTVWSPQGRLLQVEYAMEAVKQGSACLGIVGSKHVVLAALKRSPHDLAAYQKKLLKIDEHIGVAIAGLNADARTLAKYMRTECLNHKYVYGAPLQANRLLLDVADKHQRCTQMYVRRPYGVGFLVAAFDATGPHLYETCPSGNVHEYLAMAIGTRAQSVSARARGPAPVLLTASSRRASSRVAFLKSRPHRLPPNRARAHAQAKTYLEKHHASFPGLELDDLIKHALKALAGCVPSEKELDSQCASIAIVGLDSPLRILDGAEVQPYLDQIELEGGAATPEAETKDGDAPEAAGGDPMST